MTWLFIPSLSSLQRRGGKKKQQQKKNRQFKIEKILVIKRESAYQRMALTESNI